MWVNWSLVIHTQNKKVTFITFKLGSYKFVSCVKQSSATIINNFTLILHDVSKPKRNIGPSRFDSAQKILRSVSTRGIKFGSVINSGPFWSEHDIPLFSVA